MQERGLGVRSGLVYPGYIVREEIKKDKFWLEAGKRAVKLEMKLEEGRSGMLARKC